MKYSIIIPCYNEAENLEILLQKILPLCKKYEVEFVLVENGSKDSSKSLFENLPAMQNEHIVRVYVKKNRGYGYGLQQGLKVCTGDYVGWLHADMQVPIEEMVSFLDYLEKKEGKKKYFLKGIRKNRSMYDRFFTAGMSVYESVLFKTKLFDIGGIPVIFHRSLLDLVQDDAPCDFLIELYMYYLAKTNGYIIKRIPIEMVDRKYGSSSWSKGLSSKIQMSLSVLQGSIIIARRFSRERRDK